MKVLLATGIYPPEIGGPASFSLNLAQNLHKLGHEVYVVTYGTSVTRAGDGWKVWVIERGKSVFGRYLRYFLTVKKLARGSDVVFIQGAISEGIPATLAALCVGRPTVMRIPGDYAWEVYQRKVGEGKGELLDEFVKKSHGWPICLLEKLERWTTKRAARVITPSKYLKGIVEAWGVPAEQISVVHNSFEIVSAKKTREELRKEFACENKQVILSVARAVPWKGIDFLLEVLRTLSDDRLFVVLGDGPMLDAWKAQVKEMGIDSRVRFYGRQPREVVFDWMKAADVFVLASSYEGFPHVVAEAMSTGIKCLVSDKGGNPEVADLLGVHEKASVEVLPYQDFFAWKKALEKSYARLSEKTPKSFEAVTREVVEALESALDTSSAK